ncbi:helix-turn-helix transcriptional regulator [Oscillospiraceae bacterium CM]|nr:helix-turn-helix transcriptional regulator [Oscillospiraceae bacterium CM]
MYERLDILLRSRGMTPYKLAKDVGMSQSSLSEWKRGNSIPKHEKLVKIARYFDVPVDWLTEEMPADVQVGEERLLERLTVLVKEKLAAPEWNDEQAKQNLELFNALSAEKKQEALRYLRYLTALQEAEKQ